VTDFHLAQFNIGRLSAPLDTEQLSGFVNGLPEINALAEASPGFVWRHTSAGGNDATADRPYEDEEIAINLSVWETPQALWDFAYRSQHMDFLRRRREWFSKMIEPYTVLWWIPAGTNPTIAEAMERLELLRANGPGPEAFTFREQFPRPPL
jgi:Domain of unknown function (DUF3291)